MQIGIIGLPQVGKHTLFRLLTNIQENRGKDQTMVGVAKVPDPRMDNLVAYYKPRKISYAQIEATVVPGMEPGRNQEFLKGLRSVDALVMVVRCFRAPHVPFIDNALSDPLAQVRAIQEEMVLADWTLAETRLTRLQKEAKANPRTAADPALFSRLSAALAEGIPIRNIPLTKEEQLALQGLTFLSAKPAIVAVNIDEEQFRTASYPGKEQLHAWAEKEGLAVIEVYGQLEMEIGELSAEDRQLFLADAGIKETGLEKLAKAAYQLLGLISFFTVGEDEVKAWTVRQGSTAKEAAGKIHSDIARGFIRAEVVPYASFVAHNGFHGRANGGPRLEGRDYLVQDGDIIHFRFNV